MKKVLLLLLIGLVLFNCESNPSSSKNKPKGDCFILCEGNFQANEASLWQYDGTDVQGPVYWDLSANPLGDVGQSLTINNEKLYIVLNNTHKIKVLDVETQESLGAIDVPGSNPRYMAIKGNYGYLTCWNVQGIIKINLKNNSVVDTIAVGALPEHLIVDGNMLYVSIQMNAMWGSDNRVVSYDLSNENPEVVNSWEVISEPGKMLLKNNELWVASTYYSADYTTTYAGVSKINLDSKTVTKKDYGVNFRFTKDLVEINENIYRTYSDGLVKINSDLSYDESVKIGNLGKRVFSATAEDDQIYLGTSDYAAPDTVFVLSEDGTIEDELKVGAIPGSIIFVK